MKKDIGITIFFCLICIVTACMSSSFLCVNNIQNLTRLIGIFGIFSIGVGFVIITGGIDLSVGSVIALLGIVLYYFLIPFQMPWYFAVILVLLISALLGLIHGLLVTVGKIQPFIATLCGLLIYRGAARYISGDSTKGFGGCEGFESLRFLATGTLAGIPMPFILLMIIGLVAWVLLHRSVYGRYLLAIGKNEQAVRYSGINTKTVILFAYVIASLLTGVSAILFTFYCNSVAPSTHGNFYELYAIAAAVLGGCSLRGGEGSIFGIIIGTALLRVLRNLVILLGIPSSLDFAVMGFVILLSVFVDQFLKTRKKGR